MNFDNLKAIAVSRGSRGMLIVQKHSPEILMVGGIVGVVTATVLACRATLKVDDVFQEAISVKMAMDNALDDQDGNVNYDKADYQRDEIIVAIQTGVELVKLYAPAIVIGGVSIAMLLQSRNILTRRNAGLLAAYKALDEAYSKYRARIREELGDDVDKYLRTRKPEDGEELVVKSVKDGKEGDFELSQEEGNMVDFGASQYAKFYDQSSPQWRPTNEANIFFLKAQQTNANVKLTMQGHLFLNEVYDMLGIPRTKAGAVVGWVKDHGDDVVDFGIWNSLNNYNDDYINGYERQSILLDFNVDGWIWDLI